MSKLPSRVTDVLQSASSSSTDGERNRSDRPSGDVTVRPQVVSASTLARRAPPERCFVVPGLVPARAVTLLSGDGGIGKSLLALYLAVCVALGIEWLGMNVSRGRVVILTAEDELDEVHRRLEQICIFLGIELATLTDLFIVPLAGIDALLATVDRSRGVMEPTRLFGSVRDIVQRTQSTLVILDTLADFFGGDEINRSQARSFIAILRGLALEFDLAILLLAHPSISGIASGSGSSGSTGWSNSVRSRLYLERVKSEKDEVPDEDLRVLSVKKANYASAGTTIEIRWRGGCFVRDDGELKEEREVKRAARTEKADGVFLDILAKLVQQGREVSPNPSASYAPTMFEKHPDAGGIKKRVFAGAMERLLASNAIHVRTDGPPSKRRSKLALGPAPQVASDPVEPASQASDALPTPI